MLVTGDSKTGIRAGKVYLVDNGRRRWLRDKKHLEGTRFVWPNDITQIKDGELAKIPYGPSVPASISSNNTYKEARKTMFSMREYIVRDLKGSGVEFGAAANPLAVPLGCKIRYADLFETPQLENELYDLSDFEYVPTDLHTSLDKMDGIAPRSLDFIIASHVIEHVRNPIGAIELARKKLKNKGKLVLIVPKMERTLDRGRALTKIQHLIDDNDNPSRDRDALHVIDFYTYAKPIDPKESYKLALESITDDHHSMHYHVWNEKSFKILLDYIIKKSGKGWKIDMFENTCDEKGSYEFYVVLEKSFSL